jgi:hypothetical protein
LGKYLPKLPGEPKGESVRTAPDPNSRMGQDLASVKADLKRLTADLLKAGADYATARRDYGAKALKAKIDYVKIYAATDPDAKVDDRKGEALLKNQKAQADAEVAEAECDALKVVIKTLSDALNSTQTQCRLLRDEMSFTDTDAGF